MLTFRVYMLRCSDGTYYTGHTDDLEKRLAEHQAGAHDGYTSTRLPVELVWSQEQPTRDEAFAAERKLKGWSRAKKEALMRGDMERLRSLSAPRTGPDTRRRSTSLAEAFPFAARLARAASGRGEDHDG